MKFISLFVDDETQNNLTYYCVKNNINLYVDYNGNKYKSIYDFKFHLTIFYSNNEPNKLLENGTFLYPEFEVMPKGFEFLGENNNILTMLIEENKEIYYIRKYFKKEYNLLDNYPNFKPHISISYDKIKSNIPKNLPDFKIKFNKLVIKDHD